MGYARCCWEMSWFRGGLPVKELTVVVYGMVPGRMTSPPLEIDDYSHNG
jgi:hypothetical protein